MAGIENRITHYQVTRQSSNSSLTDIMYAPPFIETGYSDLELEPTLEDFDGSADGLEESDVMMHKKSSKSNDIKLGEVYDPVIMLLKDSSKFPVLNDLEQQVTVFSDIESRRQKIKELTAELIHGNLNGRTYEVEQSLKHEQTELEIRMEQIVGGNIPLVFSIAKKYVNRGIELEDLMGAGHEGLLKACSRFDYRKGNKFSTYATWWIRQSIIRSLADESRSIRLPVHLRESINKTRKTFTQLTAELQRMPTYDEVASVLSLPSETVKYHVEVSGPVLSLNRKLIAGDDFDGDTELGDTIDDERQKFEEDLLDRDELKKKFNAQVFRLKSMDPRSAYIMLARHGVLTGTPQSLEEIGIYLGLTRERIRQIEIEVLKKLKSETSPYADASSAEQQASSPDLKSFDADEFILEISRKFTSNQAYKTDDEVDQAIYRGNEEFTLTEDQERFENLLRGAHEDGVMSQPLQTAIREALIPSERMTVLFHLQPRSYAGNKPMTFEEIDKVFTFSRRKLKLPSKEVYFSAVIKIYNYLKAASV